jgi:hypothetical protein
MHQPSCTAALSLSFYMILSKPNIFSKENNSKVIFESPFYEIIFGSLFNIS